jgi:cytoskeletal protein CcmA (bactofilin family)
MSIFRRESTPPSPGSSAGPPEASQSAYSAHSANPANKRRLTHIAQGTRLAGEVTGATELLVEGELRGEVRVGSTVTVGAEGVVEGPITAPVVRIGGRVVGSVVATDRVEVSPSGSLEGDIAAPRVVIAVGAFFKGKVEMRGGGVDKAAAGRAPHGDGAARLDPPPDNSAEDNVRDRPSEKPGKKAGK